MTAPYPPITLGFDGWRERLSHPQSWRDMLLVLVMFPISVASFAVAVFWVGGALGGVTYWLWRLWIPEDNRGFADVIGSHSAWLDLVVSLVIGVVLFCTLRAVLRALLRLHSAIAFRLIDVTDISTPRPGDSGAGPAGRSTPAVNVPTGRRWFRTGHFT